MRPLLHRPALLPRLLVLAFGFALVLAPAAHAELSASLTFSPTSPLTGEIVSFVSTSQGAVGAPTWDLDGDEDCDDAEGQSVRRPFARPGAHSVTVCVTDGVERDEQDRTVNVRNRPPVAAFTFAPTSPLTGDAVTLTSTSFDPDGSIAGLLWDLDNDGAFDDATGAGASLSVPAEGSHAVRLMAVDREGAAAIAEQSIAVAARPVEVRARWVLLLPVVRFVATISARGTRVRSLTVRAPPGSQVKVRCRGRGCPFRRFKRLVSPPASADGVGAQGTKLVSVRRLRKRTLRSGAVLRIWVTKANSIGRYTRFRTRRRKAPRRTDLCVIPGAPEPSRCPGEIPVAASR